MFQIIKNMVILILVKRSRFKTRLHQNVYAVLFSRLYDESIRGWIVNVNCLSSENSDKKTKG